MTANWPILLLALALLGWPRSWLRRGKSIWRSRRRSMRPSSWANPPKDGNSLGFAREFTKPRNYIDLARAWLGATALMGGSGFEAALRVAPHSPPAMAQRLLAVQAAVLVLAVVIQTVRFERRRISLGAPVFYVAGLSFAVFGPFVGLCGFVIAWALNPVATNAQAFLIVQAGTAAMAAYFLEGLTLRALIAFGVDVVPVILSLLTRRPLVVFSPRGISSSRGAA